MRKIPYLHIVLFVATFLSTLVAGSFFQKGINLLNEPWRIVEGLPFSLTLMTILLCHELAHFVSSRAHHTQATLPYFIPAPISLVGTFGAFIKMKSPIITRKALIDIGASGPIAGFVVSVIACVIGLERSHIGPVAQFEEGAIQLGDSLLFSLLVKILIGVPPEGYDVFLDPIAFAGWFGFFVTSLNLVPIGQSDGGHIVFGLIGEKHRPVSIVLLIVLAALGLSDILGAQSTVVWFVWAVLMLILGIKHPPIMYWEARLDPKRRGIGLLTFIIFIVTFIPSPFRISL